MDGSDEQAARDAKSNSESSPPSGDIPRPKHGLERLPMAFPTSEELRREPDLKQREEARRAMGLSPQVPPLAPVTSGSQTSPTNPTNPTNIAPEDEEWLAAEHALTIGRLVAIKWWTNHVGWFVLSLCVAIPLVLTISQSWWFLLGFPVALLMAVVVQRLFANLFAALARGRIHDAGREITWPGNVFVFVVVPVVLLGHLIGKL